MELITPTDFEIWTKFKNGDNNALTIIYSKNCRSLYLFGLKLTNHHTVIEDSIQDLFTDLVRTRKNLADTDNIHFYLLRSFKRKLIRLLAKEQRYNLTDKPEEYKFEITYSAEHKIISEEISDQKSLAIRKALTLLTSRQKEAIYLKFTEGLKYEEIAEIMDMSIEACRNLIYRSIKSLKNALQEHTSLVFFVLHHLG